MGREVGAYVCAETHGSLRDSARTWARLPRIRGGLGRVCFCPKKLGNFTKSKDYLHIPQDLQGGQNGAFRRAEGGTPE